MYRAENKEKIAIAEHKYINTESGYVREVINGVFSRHKKKNDRLKWIPECTRQDVYEELILYIQDHGRVCEYCREPWTYKRVMGVRGQGFNARGPKIVTNFSIDRLDATKTYELGNIVFCCVGCNLRKNQVRLSYKRPYGRQNQIFNTSYRFSRKDPFFYHTEVCYDELIETREKAIRFKIDGIKVWMPKNVVKKLSEANNTVYIWTKVYESNMLKAKTLLII